MMTGKNKISSLSIKNIYYFFYLSHHNFLLIYILTQHIIIILYILLLLLLLIITGKTSTIIYMQWQPHHAWSPPCSATLEAPTNSLLTVYSL